MSDTSADSDLVLLLRQTRAVLLDFDGPVCAVFAGVGAQAVATRLREILRADGWPTDRAGDLGPHGVLAYAATRGQSAERAVEEALADAEREAIKTASPTPGAREFLVACADTHRPVVIVSNNNGEAIETYLTAHQLAPFVAHVAGRDPTDATRMKPNPWTLRRAIDHVDAPPSAIVLVGDAVTDVQAAHQAGVSFIGYANKPGKAARLHDVGADAIVSDMRHLADAVTASGSVN